MPGPISSRDDTRLAETRRGRAWIDQAAGVRIGYTLAGTSPGTSKTVLLIHGAPQTGHAWRKVVPTLVASGYQVVVPDYRGAGASTKPRYGYDKWTMAGDLHDLVHNELGIEGPISIVGHDLGSMVAFRLCAAVSRRPHQPDHHGSAAARHRLLRATQVAKSAWHFDFHANPDIAVHLTHGRERWYISRFFDDLIYQPDAITQNDLDIYARAFEAPGAMRALCEIYRELDHDAATHRADIDANGKLTVPCSPRAAAPRPWPPTMRRCVRKSPSMSPDIWCPTPAIGSPRRIPTISVACSSSSTAQPDHTAESAQSTGETGEWNAMTGNSGGWQQATFDLSAYVGQQVAVSISYVTDPSVGGVGAFIDDTRVLVDGAASEPEGFETGLGAWSVLGPPPSSPPAGGDFQRAEGLLFSAVTTEDSVLRGFGIEQIESVAGRAAVLGKAMKHLLPSTG